MYSKAWHLNGTRTYTTPKFLWHILRTFALRFNLLLYSCICIIIFILFPRCTPLRCDNRKIRIPSFAVNFVGLSWSINFNPFWSCQVIPLHALPPTHPPYRQTLVTIPFNHPHHPHLDPHGARAVSSGSTIIRDLSRSSNDTLTLPHLTHTIIIL